jgi:glycosyltransferase involved in cell wall biosynthesis
MTFEPRALFCNERGIFMSDNYISTFLTETEPYMEQLETMSFDAAAEFYDSLDDAASVASAHIKNINPEFRIELCDRLDKVLERVVDELPSFSHGGNPIEIYTPAISFESCRKWENVELMKDCGLSGYMLAKVLNATSYMLFGTRPSDYPYLSDLPEMKMLYHESESGLEYAYGDFLLSNYPKMDILLFYGMFSKSTEYLNAYRKLRPDGKVYCALDMNKGWMDKINWRNAAVQQFSEQCDIVATSCRSLRDALNRHPDTSFPCRWFTNGFYNPTSLKVIANFVQKENILLTVGRIGTEQKNNEEQLTAFAAVSDTLKNWSLKFVGSIEPEFQAYIDSYFINYPHLKDRVIFTGPIMDKAELYNEYAKAKVFVLSSRYEGGTPNVYAEALFHGCMFVTSDIDAADDITNYGELGETYTRGDIKGLAEALLKVCSNADEQAFSVHIPKALEYARKYYDWNRNAKKLAYMLFK